MFDGYQAVSKALASAQKQVFLVDPYGDDKLISDFVPLAPEGLPVFVMCDEQYAKPSLKPAAERWIAQWQGKRRLEVRLAPARSLHDRLIVTDGSTAWVVGQSFKDLAKRAHSSLVRMDPDSAALKMTLSRNVAKGDEARVVGQGGDSRASLGPVSHAACRPSAAAFSRPGAVKGRAGRPVVPIRQTAPGYRRGFYPKIFSNALI